MDTKPSVLIVGGGLVGLSAGLFLQRFKIPFVIVEKDLEDSILPRARGMHVRTIELFRQVGIESAIQEAAVAAWEQGVFGGARRGATMVDSTALSIPSKDMLGTDPSPSNFCALPQTKLEPILRRTLEERGGELRRGCELIQLSQMATSVIARLRDAEGNESVLPVEYVIGADGGRSRVRSLLNIQSSRTAGETHYLNLFFRADLTEVVRDRTFSQCEIDNQRVRGLFLSANNTTDWSFHLEYDPALSDPIKAPDAEHVESIRAAIGLHEIPVEILAKTTWNTSVRIADTYGIGRVFLVGDAAHTMPPWGGLNGNTGIADAHNLVWKLAYVLQGKANTELLATYEQERRPVAVRNGKQALLRSDFDARFEIETETNRLVFKELRPLEALQLRYRYRLDGTFRDDNEGVVDQLVGQPGTRFPHAWIDYGGRRISTLDLFGDSYVMLKGPSSPAKFSYLAAENEINLTILKAGVDFRFLDSGVDWQTLTGRTANESLLVCPDGVVATSV